MINQSEFGESESDEGCDSVDDLDSKDCNGQSRRTYQEIKYLFDKGVNTLVERKMNCISEVVQKRVTLYSNVGMVLWRN